MPVRKPKTLSIIIPAYNESATIKEIIRRVKKAPSCGLKKQIIVVDDGSTDGTRNILRRLKSRDVTVIFHQKNQGKGAALKSGSKEP
jgi:glycosyltransferase involved in cell wall biosynthesis